MKLAIGTVCELPGEMTLHRVTRRVVIVRYLDDGRAVVREGKGKLRFVEPEKLKTTGRLRGHGKAVGAFSAQGQAAYAARGKLLNK